MLPVWATALLERLVPYRYHDDIIGDFAESYSWISSEEGRMRASQWYLGQLFRTLPAFLFEGINLGGFMFRSYILVAYRNLTKRKVFAGLNIAGLAIGMAICLLILQYVVFERSFDSYHDRIEDLYRVNLQMFSGEELQGSDQYTFHALAGAVSSAVPEIELITRYHPTYGFGTIAIPSDKPESFKVSDLAYVDPDFFEMFKYELLVGDAIDALSTPGGVVLTKSAALRFFGSTDVIGRQLDLYSWMDGSFSVRAIVEDNAGNSHIPEKIFFQLDELLQDEDSQYAGDPGWSWSNFVTFVRLHSSADLAIVTEKMDQAIYDGNREGWESRNRTASVSLQLVSDIHLYTSFEDPLSETGSYRTVWFVSIIGLFVLLIAWINYINLSTSRAMERALEVGIRKASGARRSQVTAQFLTESLLINAIALALAIAIANYAAGWLNTLADTEISNEIWKKPTLWFSLLGVFGLGSILASLYPSLVVSRYQPAEILKGLVAQSSPSSRLRQVLVVFQFSLSIALLSGTWIVYNQVEYLRGVDPGFSTDQVLVVERPGVIDDVPAYVTSRTSFFEGIRSLSAVSIASSSTMIPGNGYNMTTLARPDGAPSADAFGVSAFWIGNDFLETYSMELLAGRALDAQSEHDRNVGALLNETAMRAFGFERPEDAIGQNAIVGSDETIEIVGVLPDFNWMSAKEAASPVLIFPTRGGSFFSMKVAAGQLAGTLATVQNLFSESFPGNAFQYFLADERFDELFREEERLMSLVTVFSLFALVVAALGLVGLAALTAAQRRKEISVRKVLGASNLTIAKLLTGHFVVLVGAAMVISIPVVWLIADGWLDNFGARMSITPGAFVAPALIVLIISLMSSSFHVWKLATSSPIDGIRAN